MNDEQRIRVLEEELKVLKNEVKAVLLDLREQYLNLQNPFNAYMQPNAGTAAGAGPSVEKPAATPPPPPAPIVEEALDEQFMADEEPQDLNDAGAGSFLMDDNLPGSPPPDFGSLDVPGLNGGLGGLGSAPGFGPIEQMMGAGPGPSMSTEAPVPGPSSGMTGGEKPAIEDEEEETVPTVVQPGKHTGKKKEQAQAQATGNTKYDLMVVAGLTQWIDHATARLGKERAEALVEMSFTLGRLPENLKDALVKMVRITKNEENGHNVTASDYLAILAQLENLLGKTEMHDNALLSLISMMKEPVR